MSWGWQGCQLQMNPSEIDRPSSAGLEWIAVGDAVA